MSHILRKKKKKKGITKQKKKKNKTEKKSKATNTTNRITFFLFCFSFFGFEKKKKTPQLTRNYTITLHLIRKSFQKKKKNICQYLKLAHNIYLLKKKI
jgi:D-alanyl-lipoteichoic acid acyltransferase DltB (MBOAT superfamily)